MLMLRLLILRSLEWRMVRERQREGTFRLRDDGRSRRRHRRLKVGGDTTRTSIRSMRFVSSIRSMRFVSYIRSMRFVWSIPTILSMAPTPPLPPQGA